MTLTIDLSPAAEKQLQVAAQSQGIDPGELVRKIVTEYLPQVEPTENDPTLALFAQWDKEDAEMTPQEIEEAKRDFQEFKQNINAERERAGSRRIYT